MAWVGIFLGTLAGLLAAGLAYAGLGWPLWASALLYPAAGTSTAVLVILLLALRGTGGAGGLPEGKRPELAAA
ncbi:hypothetical protein [Cribrihabitans neustonicus]|uniref:hypothetical protein n=1 Tax=Cribrihabitans neustonicus TaxID=1429085 RepID=UPI003B5A0628